MYIGIVTFAPKCTISKQTFKQISPPRSWTPATRLSVPHIELPLKLNSWLRFWIQARFSAFLQRQITSGKLKSIYRQNGEEPYWPQWKNVNLPRPFARQPQPSADKRILRNRTEPQLKPHTRESDVRRASEPKVDARRARACLQLSFVHSTRTEDESATARM